MSVTDQGTFAIKELHAAVGGFYFLSSLYFLQEYDYVFDVDLDEGRPGLKLPYNISEDPWMAAHNWLEKNELSQLFLDQVAHFIIDQCKGIELGKGSGTGPSDPFTGNGIFKDIDLNVKNIFPD